MLENRLIEYCAPTLAGLKCANLFSCYYHSRLDIEQEIADMNRRLNCKGVYIEIMKWRENAVLLYTYRPSKLNLDLQKNGVKDLLCEYGYADGTVNSYIEKLRIRMMVDFSCALKLAMPICVLSAIREASNHHMTVKGGKYLEAMAESDAIVFDKTGTLTKAQPKVIDVISFSEKTPDELLRIAACLEEHFPHSMARAVVEAAQEKGLDHEEFHSKVEYIVAHGISTTIDGKKAIVGSAHFVFEDEKCVVPEGMKEKFDSVSTEYSQLYLAIEQRLEAIICIEDPLRPEASQIVLGLKASGIRRVVMMTGDRERAAAAIAKSAGVDEYYAEVLPEDKARFVEKEKNDGRTVIMIGDGVNDSPALSLADVGIAVSDGAQIAREIADITIDADNLDEIVTLKHISNRLMKRINRNYRLIVGINTALIILGVSGIIPPATSALLHNTSTLMISLNGMKNLLPNDTKEDN